MLACYGRSTILTDAWEPGTRKIVTELIPNLKLFVNVGANVGYYSCLAGKAGVKTIAFEPEMTNFQFLCNNVMINGFEDNVEIFPVAAGDPPPNLMKIHGVGDTASLSEEFKSVRRNVTKRRNGLRFADSLGGGIYSALSSFISVVSLDDIILKHKWLSENVLFLIDVEGWEHQVLKGAEGLLALDPKPFWIIEVLPDILAKRTEPTQVFSMMFKSGYRGYKILDEGDPVEFTETQVSSLMSENSYWNYLFIDETLSLSDI